MKIFYDYRIFYLQKYGGVSRYFANLNKELNDLNINSRIYAPININSYLKNNSMQYSEHLNLNEIYKYTEKLSTLYNEFFTNFYLKKFNPDLIHLTYFQKNLKIQKRQPIVVTVYDLIHEKYYKDYNLVKDNKFKKNYLDAADHIICISENTRTDLLSYYDINPDKTSAIHLGIDNFKKELNNKKSNFILYVGARRRYKNFEVLLNAFSLSKELVKEYKIICVGGGNFIKTEIEKFKKLNLIDQMVYYNATDSELRELYEKASVYVTTSLSEGFGLPALEAMNSGCIVLASNIKVYQEILKDYAVFFNPNEPEDLKNKLENIFFKKNFTQGNIEKAFNYSSTFTWKKCAIETLEVYKKLI